MMKRVKANDPAAIGEMGTIRYNEGDGNTGIEYWRRAAELGDLTARFQIRICVCAWKVYQEGYEKGKISF